MGQDGKQPEPEQEPGAPEWMVTFSDCMTLLLTFFVLLLSFSSFDDKGTVRQMSSIFADRFSLGSTTLSEADAVCSVIQSFQTPQVGSEKPTLNDGSKDGFKEKTEPDDFLRFRTFLVPSGDIFLGNGAAISQEGRKLLSDLSLFLKEFPDRVIILSESGSETVKNSKPIGLERAWAVLNYMTKEEGLDRKRFSLSAAGTAAKECHLNNVRQGRNGPLDRILEIVLLERGV